MMGRSLNTSSSPLGVVGVVGVVGGVDGTLNNLRLSGPFFSWLPVLFFIFFRFMGGVHVSPANNAATQLRDRFDLNR